MRTSDLRRGAALLAGVALVAALLSGCGSGGGQAVVIDTQETPTPSAASAERVTLTFFGYKADAINLTAIEDALRGFMAERQDVVITYEGVKGSPYWESFEKRAGTGNLDDVVMIDHDRVLSLNADGKLADLSGVPGLENFNAQARAQFTDPDGSVWFLPTCISTYNLYINYDLLERNGQSVPTNWAQFAQVCDWFAARGVTPIIANNYNSLPTLMVSKALYETYQGEDVAAAIQGFNADPASLAQAMEPGVEMVAEMLERGWMDPAEVLATAQTSDDLELFAQGERPFMITGGWASVRVSAKQPGFSYGVHPYPILEDGCVLSMDVNTCIAVNADSSALSAAKDFVAYLIRPDVMWAYCDSQASYTPLREERIPSEETLVPSTEYLNNGRSVIGADYRLSVPLNGALKECGTILLGGGTVEEAKAALLKSLTD